MHSSSLVCSYELNYVLQIAREANYKVTRERRKKRRVETAVANERWGKKEALPSFILSPNGHTRKWEMHKKVISMDRVTDKVFHTHRLADLGTMHQHVSKAEDQLWLRIESIIGIKPGVLYNSFFPSNAKVLFCRQKREEWVRWI